jgi:histone deacetylase 6
MFLLTLPIQRCNNPRYTGSSGLLIPSQDSEFYIPRAEEHSLQHQIQELICYVWDNYLQVSEATIVDPPEIFLMGVGNANLGIKVLLISRGMHIRIPTRC